MVSVIDVAPVTALKVAELPQLLNVAGDELLTVTFAGKLSTMEKLVRSVSRGAGMLILILEFSPGKIVEGEKDLVAGIPLPMG